MKLIPLDEYNITSAYGCYKSSSAELDDGIDPDAAFADGVGCRGKW
jgi:hypothetical protein